MKNTKLVAIVVLQAVLVMGILSQVNGTYAADDHVSFTIDN
jgi:hypothetical protein